MSKYLFAATIEASKGGIDTVQKVPSAKSSTWARYSGISLRECSIPCSQSRMPVNPNGYLLLNQTDGFGREPS